ncbi:AlpA family transcriptional regulator [Defluviimonas aestuarii]|uniref:helix-turn-helix transcriptional regulator n=1 Tax=Albidovulum aestuarii TaxID=1130726 RepID=UPI00249B5FE9|nr:AlpA family transcriptional regulator [Defluviimonas aestuarii]MDI3336858.1 AlpA family transcriptional regulator [Defluviimonas aestuarii]
MMDDKNWNHELRLLTRAEVEAIFGFPTRRYLEIAAGTGTGPVEIRIGRTVRYRASDVQAWIEQHRATRQS